MFKTFKVSLREYQDQKSGLLTVSTESGYIHQSYLTDEGHVLVFEFNPYNYPASIMGLHDNLEKYVESIKEVSWINEPEWIRTYDEELLGGAGFPFNQEIEVVC